MPVKIATAATGIALILALVGVIEWRLVGFIFAGCSIYVMLMAYLNTKQQMKDEQ